MTVAEKLRCALSNAAILVGSQHITVTASFGIAQVWPHDTAIEQVLERADVALYGAKKAGRNCVKRAIEVVPEAR